MRLFWQRCGVYSDTLVKPHETFPFSCLSITPILDSAAPAFGVKVFPMVHWAAGLSCT